MQVNSCSIFSNNWSDDGIFIYSLPAAKEMLSEAKLQTVSHSFGSWQKVTVLEETIVVNSLPLVYVDDDINSSIILNPANSFHFIDIMHSWNSKGKRCNKDRIVLINCGNEYF